MTTLLDLRHLVGARLALPSPEERRRIRVEAGITVKTLATHLGISVSSMNSLERSAHPGEEHLVAYADALAAMRIPPGAELALTPQEAKELRDQWEREACGACGGLHTTAIKAPGACPRIKRITYDAQGRMLEVEYWPEGKWPKDGIVWPDEIVTED